ncbi:MAG: hypothetical protein J0L51_14655 [Rhizobiales bacterium]|nr:hypothetical protein [Hyphomicrobiales bacterium]
MGQAKQKKQAGARISWCRTCTYCCVLPKIVALDKPMYRRCKHIENQGCGIFGQPERPSACISYNCAYLSARLAESPDRNRIPHPLEAGAYFHRDPIEKAVVLFVDPDRPDLWKASAIPDLMRNVVRGRETLVIFDRGHQMTVTNVEQLDAIVTRDFVAFAEGQGRQPDFPEFREWAQPDTETT